MEKEKIIDENYVNKLISINVKRLRTLQNISQLNLSNATGLTHNFIHDIENCKKEIGRASCRERV